MHACMHPSMDGWMNRWMDGREDTWMDVGREVDR